MEEVMTRKLPKEVDYSNILPLAVPSSSNRRQFLPNNGDTFTPDGSNIIRIDINADSMLDASSSYLQFTINNTSADATNFLATDVGVPWIQRLRIESGGITLEDIHEYGRLYAMLEFSQASQSKFENENSIFLNQSNCCATATAGAVVGAVCAIPRIYSNAHTNSTGDTTTRIASGTSKTCCVNLVSALLNCSHYIPLILQNAGLTLELSLAPNTKVGIATQSNGAEPAVQVSVAPSYSIDKCRYVAHLVDMDRQFYDSLRQEMMMTGSIALHGHGWRHFGSTIPAGNNTFNINIPARQKSIKSIFSTFRNSAYDTDDGVAGANNELYSTSVLQRQNISGWFYKIGSVNYPQSSVAVGASNLAPTLCELQKAFGKLGTYDSESCMSINTYNANIVGCAGGDPVETFCIGYDLEAFQKSALESGVNTAERALPINLELTFDGLGSANNITCDNYVCADQFFYVNSDGTMSPSS